MKGRGLPCAGEVVGTIDEDALSGHEARLAARPDAADVGGKDVSEISRRQRLDRAPLLVAALLKAGATPVGN